MATIEPILVPTNPLKRSSTADATLPNTASSFILDNSHKSYKHQFANLYFARLRLLKDVVKTRAQVRWKGMKGSPLLVPRVLDIVKAQLCFIIGTVYMEMPQKPNVLDDLTRDRSLPAPPSRLKYHSSEDAIMLEDESGRVQLVGDTLRRAIDIGGGEEPSEGGWANLLVTGVIMAALGVETTAGEFDVKDFCFASMAPMMYEPADTAVGTMDIDDTEDQDEWVAIISGLQIDEDSAPDIRLELLSEYLSGEAGATSDQADSTKISRLIIAGNSLAPVAATTDKPCPAPETSAKSKRFGQEASNFSAVPVTTLGCFLSDVVRAMPTHLLAGATDPSGILLPQQPLPRSMFGEASKLENFRCETNPVWLGLENNLLSTKRKRSVFVHSGQSLEDMYKYVPSPPTTRLDLACASLHWRHAAPTAPDTLWCYPYFTQDPFALRATPDLYIIGCQPEFGTRLLSNVDFEDTPDPAEEERKCRVVVVPGFKETGTLVLVNLKNLEVKTIEFGPQPVKSKQ